MDGQRIIELALDIPDAIAPQRRRAVVERKVLRLTEPNTRYNDSYYRWLPELIDLTATAIDDGTLDAHFADLEDDTDDVGANLGWLAFGAPEPGTLFSPGDHEFVVTRARALVDLVVTWVQRHPRLDGDLPTT